MFTKVTLALGLLLGTCSTQAVMAQTAQEDCVAIGNVALTVSEMRNMGYPPQVAYQLLMAGGLNHEAAYKLVEVVYSVLGDLEPAEVAETYFKACMASAA